MKNLLFVLGCFFSLMLTPSCEDIGPQILEQPTTNMITIDTMF